MTEEIASLSRCRVTPRNGGMVAEGIASALTRLAMTGKKGSSL